MKKLFALICTFVLVAGCAACGAPASSGSAPSGNAPASPAPAAGDLPQVKAKLACIYAETHAEGRISKAFAEKVSELTGGKFVIDVYYGAQLGNMSEAFDSLELGSIEFDAGPFSEAAKRWAPASITDAPYIFSDRDQEVRIMSGPAFDALAAGISENVGVTPLVSFYGGTRHITTAKTKATTPAEIAAAGLKIRTPETTTAIAAMKICGATPTPLALSDAYIAMQQGAVDGQENPLATILSNAFHEVQDYILMTGHIIQPKTIYVNDEFMASLPAAYQDAVREAARYAAEAGNVWEFEAEDAALQELIDHGMEAVEVDTAAFMAAAASYHQEMIASTWGQELYDSFKGA